MLEIFHICIGFACISAVKSFNMLPKTWQELLDALTLQHRKTGVVNRMSSEEDAIFVHLNERIYRYGRFPVCRLKMELSDSNVMYRYNLRGNWHEKSSQVLQLL
jgi:hypothetical protein